MTRQRRVALATCAAYPQLYADDLLLAPAFAGAGLAAEPAVWSDPAVRWRDYAAVLIRSTWDYYERLAEFRAWLDRLEAAGVRVFNEPQTLRGNLDKGYLQGLAARGVPTVPTVWLPVAVRGDLAVHLAALPWEEVVVKPAVSAGAFRTVRTTRAALQRDPAPVDEILAGGCAALVQPLLPEIQSDGEWSLLYFGGSFSHAVVKTAKPGDFRVQWRHGGSHRSAAADAALRDQAAAVLTAAGGAPLYARVDGIVRAGQLVLVELELLEPYLFLAEDLPAAGRLARALAARL